VTKEELNILIHAAEKPSIGQKIFFKKVREKNDN